MAIEVDIAGADVTVEFPDETSLETIKQTIAKKFGETPSSEPEFNKMIPSFLAQGRKIDETSLQQEFQKRQIQEEQNKKIREAFQIPEASLTKGLPFSSGLESVLQKTGISESPSAGAQVVRGVTRPLAGILESSTSPLGLGSLFVGGPLLKIPGVLKMLGLVGAAGTVAGGTKAVSGALEGDIEKASTGAIESGLSFFGSKAAFKGAGKLAAQASEILTPKGVKPVSKGKLMLSGAVESISSRLNKLGESGQEIVKRANLVEEITAGRIGKTNRVIAESLQDLSDAELSNFVDVLDTGVKPLNDTVKNSVNRIQPLLQEVAQEAQAKIPKFLPRDQFFPRQFEKETIQKLLNDKDALLEKASELVKKGQFEDVAQAEQAIRDAFRIQMGGRKFSSLDFPREVDLPGWIRDPKVVLPRYFQGAYKRIAEIEQFGLKDVELKKLISGIGKEFGQPAEQFALDAARSIVRDYNFAGTLEDASQAIRTFEVITKLGLAQITNLGQTNNTFIRTNLRSTLQGIRAAFTKEGKDFAQDAGALINSVHEELAGSSSLADSFLKATGFNKVESFNRTVAANAGKVYAEKTFSKLLKNPEDISSQQKLQELGINVKKALAKGFLSKKDLERAAFRVNKSSQFTSQPQDLPLFWQSPLGKVATQFKSFAFQHGKFMKDYVINEAKQGNVTPLVRAVIGAATLGEVITDTKKLTKLENPFESREKQGVLERQLENFFQLGGFGLFTDILKSSEFGTQAITGFLAGPAASDVAGLVTPAAQMIQPITEGRLPTKKEVKQRSKTLGKQVTKQIPVIGRPLAEQIFPKKK